MLDSNTPVNIKDELARQGKLVKLKLGVAGGVGFEPTSRRVSTADRFAVDWFKPSSPNPPMLRVEGFEPSRGATPVVLKTTASSSFAIPAYKNGKEKRIKQFSSLAVFLCRFPKHRLLL